LKKGDKTGWVPPSPFTPMPAYDNMATPELKVINYSKNVKEHLRFLQDFVNGFYCHIMLEC
jgi:hypothetical protein